MASQNGMQQQVRDFAYRIGLPRFWRWWMAELAQLVPASSRGAIRRRLTRPVIEFGDGQATFLRAQVVDGRVALTKVAAVALSGEAAEVAAAGRAAVDSLAATANGSNGPLKVNVALPPNQVLRKELTLPAAVEENLRQTLAYDLDRHTPFRPEQVYFDAVVVGRDPVRRTIRVEWAAALKTVVDGPRKQVESWGADVVAVVPGPAAAPVRRLNLIPLEARSRAPLWRRWDVWVPTALVLVTALAVVIVPLLQKREYAIALNEKMEQAHHQADAADALRQRLERMQDDYNYVLQKKYAYPSALVIIDDVTKVLPDDTWITALELKTSSKGKDVQRELALRGESGNGGKLISLLEDSRLVEQAALRSPTTKLQPGPGELFDLGALVRALPRPEAKPLVVASDNLAAPAPAPTSPAPAQPAAKPTTPAATATPPAQSPTPTPGPNSAPSAAPVPAPSGAAAPPPAPGAAAAKSVGARS
jgi:general secretion pathway protein L